MRGDYIIRGRYLESPRREKGTSVSMSMHFFLYI